MYDDTCKFIAANFSRDLASWLLGKAMELPQMRHRYNVIRLWEVPTEELLASPGLLPLAALSRTDNPVKVLEHTR